MECPGQGRDNRSIIKIVVETQFQAGYIVSPSGVCFTSPFLLLAACLDPEKAYLGKKSEGNIGATEKTSASSDVAIGCKASGYELASRSFVARWMDPKVGRFASADPWFGDPQAPISLHQYLYSNQSPVSFKDPTGNWTLLEVSFTVARLGFLYTNVAIGSTMLRFAVATPTDEVQKCWYNCMVDQTSNYISAMTAIFAEGFVSTPKFLLNPGNTGGPNPFTNIIRNLSVSLRSLPSLKKAPEMIAQFVKRGPLGKVPVYAANAVYLAASGMILYNAISCMQTCTRDPSCYEHSNE